MNSKDQIEAIVKIGISYHPVHLMSAKHIRENEIWYQVVLDEAPWMEEVWVKEEDIFFKKLYVTQ